MYLRAVPRHAFLAVDLVHEERPHYCDRDGRLRVAKARRWGIRDELQKRFAGVLHKPRGMGPWRAVRRVGELHDDPSCDFPSETSGTLKAI